mmetsp:Transcript_28517/g.77202  ORF Transcript_28517/g.77202 Transcript_28517/m.77202 type:complete len:174 (-) Transcript_28517:131-652(-)|eukprot:CAMPEP_0172365836 /NCGR_PEP_ID=MMETSP1060-20121228/12267_1 /TAXON_ID=37318 /ORGANISM="Pseudo-nitzschia pungens, Strain cf. cingulata" /LENGTH=173 /DNA_ID=CAMNT_0013089403 /DNA_START=114 /DNA_END=635 /DNA_ORIENTATION=-
MSMKIVRKLLQQDTIDAAEEPSSSLAGTGIAESVGDASAKKRRNKRRLASASSSVAVSAQDALTATVQSMMYLDEAMATHTGRSESQAKAAKRLEQNSRDAKKRRRACKHAILGNSRSSASQMTRLPSVPTFDKKRHKKEVEAKRLKEIARLLNQQKRKQQKLRKNERKTDSE